MTTISPVIAGLAIGAAFVMLLAVIFQTVEDIGARHAFAITIDGLKKSYSAGEQIDFEVKVKGYGRGCSYPDVKIINAQSGEVVWSPEWSAILLCISDPDDYPAINITWRPEDWADSPITINEPGTYIVQVDFGKKQVQEFTVST